MVGRQIPLVLLIQDRGRSSYEYRRYIKGMPFERHYLHLL